MNIKTEFLLPVMVLFSSNSQAMDWLFEPDFNFRERYEDNVTMQTSSGNMVSTMISTFSPGVLLGYLDDNNQLKTHFNWNELMYHSASDLDFSEKILDLSHQYQGERFRINLDGGYHEQSAINTQLDEAGSGRLSSKLIPQKTLSISPDLLVNLTERNSLQFSYSYHDVSFDRPEHLQNLSYSDYTNQQISATAIHSYSERLSLNIMGAYSKYESSNTIENDTQILAGQLIPIPPFIQPVNTNRHVTQGFEQISTTFFYQAGFQYAFDEQTHLSISAGMRDTTTQTTQTTSISYNPEIDNPASPGSYKNVTQEYTSPESQTSGHVFSASLARRGEWGNFSLNAGQQLNPASSGSQQQTTSFSAQARYNLTERWSTGLNASYLISESTSTFGNSSTSFNRTYFTVSPNIQWRWTPEINLELAYTHREQEYTDRHQTAIGDTIQLQFSYQPQTNRQVK